MQRVNAKRYLQLSHKLSQCFGKTLTCTLCKNKDGENQKGHDAKVHRSSNELLRLFEQLDQPESRGPIIYLALGPLAQNPSERKWSWIDYINEDVIKNVFADMLLFDPQKVFLISDDNDVHFYQNQFLADKHNYIISSLDLERMSWCGDKLDDKAAELAKVNKVSSIQTSFGNGNIYIFNMTKLKKIPWYLHKYLRSNQIIKVGVGIYDDMQYLLDQYKQAVWHVFDLRYLYLYQNVLPWETMGNGLKEAGRAILGLNLKKFNAYQWGYLVRRRVWGAKLINYSARDVNVGLSITFICGALVYPKQTESLKELEKYIYDRLLLPYVDVGWNQVQFSRIMEIQRHAKQDPMPPSERAENRKNHRSKFYAGHSGLQYPHQHYRYY